MGNSITPGRIWPDDCHLCLAPVPRPGLCDNCECLLAGPGMTCPGCAAPVPAAGWCGECLRDPPAFDDVLSAYAYRFPLDRLLHRFKYSADFAVGACLGAALARRVDAAPRPNLVLATPMSDKRLRERGFNQALWLARRVACAASLPFDARSLHKPVHTPPQTGHDRRLRSRNLRGAFAVRRRLDGLHVAVVDDVVTTGATLHELAIVLKSAGAARVTGWVLARVPPPKAG